eukprot:4446088-Amphidinium_carterae.2
MRLQSWRMRACNNIVTNCSTADDDWEVGADNSVTAALTNCAMGSFLCLVAWRLGAKLMLSLRVEDGCWDGVLENNYGVVPKIVQTQAILPRIPRKTITTVQDIPTSTCAS